jgi:hypothetical protein
MSGTPLNKSPWLTDPVKESWLIMVPSILPVVVVLVFKDYFLNHPVSSLWWILLVVCIDVSHVYSTLFRMYWDTPTFQQYKKLLLIIPIVGFIIGFVLHYYSQTMFWRILAYVAVFHFVRQQYGFMRLYSRQENNPRWIKFIDTISIYNATLYPLLYWHIHLTNRINWFVKDDFIAIPFQYTEVFTVIYISILTIYIVKEVWSFFKLKRFNTPKNLIVIGTYASWYVGIVLFQGDLIFTLLNVVAHGIPYMGLVWLYGEKKAAHGFNFGWKGILVFLGILIMLAYVEEGIWDLFVWRDHTEVFPVVSSLIDPLNHPLALSILVPMLVLPQITHYVLDGFIWKFSKDPSARI